MKNLNLDGYTSAEDIIGINIYGGKSLFKGVKETPEEADIIHCDHASECSFYKAGKCLKCRLPFSKNDCVYGKKETAYGYTSRAAKHSAWNHHFHSHPAYAKVHALDNDMTFGVVGDYYCFRTSYSGIKGMIYDEEHPLCDDAWATNHTFFVKKEDVTADFLYKLFTMKPCSLMGGVIADYQKKIVPSMKAEIKMKTPELYAEYEKGFPEEAGVTYIGKKAYIYSLKPGCILKKDGMTFVLTEDRSKLICEEYHSAFAPFKAKKMYLEITIEKDMVCEITSDEQIAEDTILA